MSSHLDPDEIRRVKVHPGKCPKCKLTAMVTPTDRMCPACGASWRNH